jgi:predicted Zn-dependent peptidase
MPLPAQTGYHMVEGSDETATQDVNQGKLCMGFTTGISCNEKRYFALQVFNTIFGGGMTSKLFSHIREKLSLCYAIHSSMVGTKGLITVSAGIDSQMDKTVREEILRQLDLCCQGEISAQELLAAKQGLRRTLQGVHDAPGAIEVYYSAAANVGPDMTPEEWMKEVDQVTVADVQEVAKQVQLHSVFFLKGVEA